MSGTDRNDKQWTRWVAESYDEVVAEHPDDGCPLAASREAVANAYAEAVGAGETRWQLNLQDEGRLLFDRTVKPMRNERRGGLAKDGKYLLSALNDETILGSDDPALDQAYPLGMKDGRDKTLRHWTAEDWLQASLARYRNAAEVTRAAEEFDQGVAKEFMRALRTRGANVTGDLFEDDDSDPPAEEEGP